MRIKAKSLKSNKKYRDAPRFKAIYQYEDDFKNNWKNILALGLVEFKLELAKTITGKRELKK